MQRIKINYKVNTAIVLIAIFYLFYHYIVLAHDPLSSSISTEGGYKSYQKQNDGQINDDHADDHSDGHFYATVTLGLLDKVSTQVVEKKLTVNKPIRFGPLVIEVKYCWFSESALYPETKVYLIISEDANNLPRSSLSEAKIVFAGWMITSAPSLSTFEHPVYDVWVMAVDPKTQLIGNPLNKNQPIVHKPLDSNPPKSLPLADSNASEYSHHSQSSTTSHPIHSANQGYQNQLNKKDDPSTAQSLDDMIKSFIQQ